MTSRGDKIRIHSGKVSLLFELLSTLKYQFNRESYELKKIESIAIDIDDLFSQEEINNLSNLFKEIYNCPSIPLDDGESIFKNVERS